MHGGPVVVEGPGRGGGGQAGPPPAGLLSVVRGCTHGPLKGSWVYACRGAAGATYVTT